MDNLQRVGGTDLLLVFPYVLCTLFHSAVPCLGPPHPVPGLGTAYPVPGLGPPYLVLHLGLLYSALVCQTTSCIGKVM